MGEVYRTTDTNLKHQVAVTVLPASAADDSGRTKAPGRVDRSILRE